MKIAVVAPSIFPVRSDLPYGGAEYAIYQLCRQLGENGHEYVLVAPKGSEAPKGTLIETVEPKAREAAWTGEEEWDAWEIMEYTVDWDKFDIIHDHSHQALIYKARCHYPNLKLVHTCHGLQTWGGHMPNFHGPANLLSLSKFHQDVTKGPIGSMTGAVGMDSRIVVHGVDTEIYKPDPDKEITDNFLVFGLMAPHKGHVLPLTVWMKQHTTNSSHGPLIVAGEDQFVGDRNYVRTVKELCEGPDDKPVGTYLGGVSQDKKVDLFQTSRAVFLPFMVNPGEAWSLITLEALACGCPVITTPNGAIPEMIEVGKTGFIVTNDDELWAAAQKVHTLDREYISKSVKGKWDLEAMYKSYYAQYEATVKGEMW